MNKIIKPSIIATIVSLSFSAFANDELKPYIVQLAERPVATYAGGTANLAATQPLAGQRLNMGAANVAAYINYLENKQDQVIANLGDDATILHRYNVVYNGFSALLTEAQARKLASTAGVVMITEDEPRELDTSYTPAFLGIDAANGLWSQLGGTSGAGEDIIVGIVDGGVSPENASFSDKVDENGVPVAAHLPGTVVYGAAPTGWSGNCQAGPGFQLSDCNNKLIGAQYFDATFQALQASYPIHWREYASSPRDQGGHGTHTGSTAAGNFNVPVIKNGVEIGRASGIAPRARIASYKVCWTYIDPSTAVPPNSPKNSCFTGDNVAAIEKAVSDGVHVINYSISGTQTNFMDAVEQAFFAATRAGVFVAASGGNSGPANQVAHISPWLTTVGASTHDRYMEAALTLDSGAIYKGRSLAKALANRPMILSTDAGLPGADTTKVRLCFDEAVLDPAKVANKIVVCDRGVNARVAKADAVKNAGGVGMVLVNMTAAESLNEDIHSVPSVHLDNVAGAAVKAYVAANPSASGAISEAAHQPGKVIAPMMASFSSRGPNKANANILKPDLTAPGVSILASYATIVNTQEERDAIANFSVVPTPNWDFLQGTSMSSPHVAGLGALLRHKYPSWSPSAIKSALMTTTYSVFADTQPGAAQGQLPWGQGAGHVNPNKAADPGLVFDITNEDYYRFLCGANALPANNPNCVAYGKINAFDLNLASMTVADVYGKATLTRTVKNVSDVTSTYIASGSLPGFTVTVTPSLLTLNPGQSATFKVLLTRTTAAFNAWQFGEVVWNDGVHNVRSVLSAKASALTAPTGIDDTRAVASKFFTVGVGYTGNLALVKGGLKAATRQNNVIGTATTASNFADCLANKPGMQSYPITVPSGALVTRVALFDANTSAGSDLDLELYNAAGTKLASSLNSSSNEWVQLRLPAAGTYHACVVGYATPSAGANYTLFSWVVNPNDTGSNFKVAGPSNVFVGGTASIAMSWNATPDKYMAGIRYLDGSNATLGSTAVFIDAEPVMAAPNNVTSTFSAKAAVQAKIDAQR